MGIQRELVYPAQNCAMRGDRDPIACVLSDPGLNHVYCNRIGLHVTAVTGGKKQSEPASAPPQTRVISGSIVAFPEHIVGRVLVQVHQL